MELITLCGLFIVIIAVMAEIELAAKKIGKMVRTSRLTNKNGLHAKAVSHCDSMTSLPVCLSQLPRYQKAA